MKENEISYAIRGAIFKTYNELGPGLLESVYEQSIAFELEEMGYRIQRQVGIPMKYKKINFNIGFRLDILVEDLVIIEIKSVENLMDVHHKQLQTYLKLSNKKLGILVNFNTSDLRESIIRVVNNL